MLFTKENRIEKCLSRIERDITKYIHSNLMSQLMLLSDSYFSTDDKIEVFCNPAEIWNRRITRYYNFVTGSKSSKLSSKEKAKFLNELIVSTVNKNFEGYKNIQNEIFKTGNKLYIKIIFKI